MEESYIRGVNQELIRTLKKLIEATENQQQAIIDKLTEVSTAITGKLDTVITNQHEISITADTINLNTDTVEAKLDEVKASIEATNDKFDTAQASLNSINGAAQYLNPTHLAVVAAGDTTFDQNVVLCNITNDNITVTVTAADDTTASSIVLAPGWNPVIVKSVTGAVENTLVYGY